MFPLQDLLNGAAISVNKGATVIRAQELDWTYWSAEGNQNIVGGLDIVLAAGT